MPENRIKKPRMITLFLVVFFAVLMCYTVPAAADDADQLKYLPGQWSYSDTVEKDGEAPRKVNLTLSLEESGEMSLVCAAEDGGYQYTCTGTWTSEFMPEAMDRLTLQFTFPDNPLYAGNGYSMTCVYNLYTESWVENDTWKIHLLLEGSDEDSISPFEELLGSDNLDLYREQQPNRRIVNCRNYVSLRAKPSVSSARLAKVPLGALVLALPEAEEQNGFVLCTYHDEYGYILSEYLETVE